MPGDLDHMPMTLAASPAVRCGLCRLPVARSATNPPTLIHQARAALHNGGAAVVLFDDGPCPQEGAAIPEALIPRIPLAAPRRRG